MKNDNQWIQGRKTAVHEGGKAVEWGIHLPIQAW